MGIRRVVESLLEVEAEYGIDIAFSLCEASDLEWWTVGGII